MKKDNPLITVIIPVYNGERFLAEAIDSVLAQGYSPLEVIVIDDGSTDRSAMIAKSYEEVKYHYQPNSGLSAALNNGIKHAKGSYFAFIDDDDLWMEDKLTCQMEAFSKNPGLEAVFGYHTRFASQELLAANTELGSRISNQQLPALFKGAMLIKRDAFHRIGLFDTSLTMGDFVDWYKRAMEAKLKMLILPIVVMKRRIHESNKSVRDRHAMKDYVHIMKAALDRQRKKNTGYE